VRVLEPPGAKKTKEDRESRIPRVTVTPRSRRSGVQVQRKETVRWSHVPRGIPDFRPSPNGVDLTLSPASLTPNAGAALTGFFTNEHPPTSENDWAWTDSFQFT
jgi:hypothetical protein